MDKFLKEWTLEDRIEADTTGIYQFLGKYFSINEGEVIKAKINLCKYLKEDEKENGGSEMEGTP